MKYVVVMTHFFEKMSANRPILILPTMLEMRIQNCAVLQTAFKLRWSVKPASRKTNFMWKLIAPIDPMEAMLPRSKSQNGQLPISAEYGKGFRLRSGGGSAAPSG